MCISDSGLPNIVRLIVFFGTKRRVAQILYQYIDLFISCITHSDRHFHQCAMIVHRWLCFHFSNARLIALPEEKEPSTLPAFISRKPAITPLESLDFFLVSIGTRVGKSASRFVVTCLSSLTSSSSARRRFSNTAVVMRSVYQNWCFLPREVGEGFVGLGHPQHIFFFLYGAPLVIGRVHKFLGELLRHRLALAAAGGDEYPAEGERLLALGAHLAGHLVVRTPDAPRADFHRGADVADGRLKHVERRFGLGLIFNDVKRVVNHLESGGLFAVPHKGVDELFHALRAVLKVDSGDVAVFYWSSHCFISYLLLVVLVVFIS